MSGIPTPNSIDDAPEKFRPSWWNDEIEANRRGGSGDEKAAAAVRRIRPEGFATAPGCVR